MPQAEQSWLSERDLVGLLTLSGFEWLKTYRTALVPKYVPLLSASSTGSLPSCLCCTVYA